MMVFPNPFEGVDPDDPRQVMERSESETRAGGLTMGSQADFVGKLLAWLVASGDLRDIGIRTLYAAHRIRPDIYPGGQLHSMMTPQRLADLQRDFEANFGDALPRAGPPERRPHAGAAGLRG